MLKATTATVIDSGLNMYHEYVSFEGRLVPR